MNPFEPPAVGDTPDGLKMFRPPWCDPSFILASNLIQTNDLTFLDSNVHLIAGNNPRRWGIGFITIFSVPGMIGFGPWPDIQNCAIAPAAAQVMSWFDLFTFGPMVCHEWYGQGSGSMGVRVVELLIN